MDPGVESGSTGTEAFAVNDSGQLVGFSVIGDINRAVLWSATGGFTDLGTLGGTNSTAFGINNAGQVVGSSGTP